MIASRSAALPTAGAKRSLAESAGSLGISDSRNPGAYAIRERSRVAFHLIAVCGDHLDDLRVVAEDRRVVRRSIAEPGTERVGR